MSHGSVSSERLGRNFWSLWTATACSNLGDGMYKFILPVLAISLTPSPTLVASVSFVLSLPWLLLSLPAGVMVDRIDRRKVMILARLLSGILLIFLLLGAKFDWLNITLLLGVSFLLGTSETLSINAAGSLVPSIVPRAKLEQANARIVSIETIMDNFIGKPIAGFLISVSAVLSLASGAIVYLLTLSALFSMKGQFIAERMTKQSISRDMLEGVRYLWNHRLLRTLAGMVAVMAGCWSGFFAVLVLYALSPIGMNLTEFQYSLLLTALAAGSLTGASLVTPIQRLLGKRWLLGLDIIGTITMLLIPALTTNYLLVGLAIFIGGFGGGTWSVIVNSIRQSMVPNELMGRVYSAYRLVGWGTFPLGALIAGVIAEAWGVEYFFILGACLNLLLFIPMARVLTNENLQAYVEA